jgi:hypothetical protein
MSLLALVLYKVRDSTLLNLFLVYIPGLVSASSRLVFRPSWISYPYDCKKTELLLSNNVVLS